MAFWSLIFCAYFFLITYDNTHFHVNFIKLNFGPVSVWIFDQITYRFTLFLVEENIAIEYFFLCYIFLTDLHVLMVRGQKNTFIENVCSCVRMSSLDSRKVDELMRRIEYI